MAYVIAEPCGGCKDRSCVTACPLDCIHEGWVAGEDGKVYEQLFIDPGECIHCGLCEPECPVEAIFPEDEVPPEWRHFVRLNAAFYGATSAADGSESPVSSHVPSR
jgi:Formate hydrogenlyase subunit 6/NADH:ubiquinone oxidoreductase 23 kD subunit (chain I)